MSLLLKIVIITVTSTTITFQEKTDWLWTWTCNRSTNNCEKLSSSAYELEMHSQSLDVCRLTCGKYGALWPVPSVSTYLDNKLLHIHPSNITYTLLYNTYNSLEYFNIITNLFEENLYHECAGNSYELFNSTVLIIADVTSHEVDLFPNVDESYNLEITTKANNTVIKIKSETLFGTRHALETLSQLFASYKMRQSDNSKCALVLVSNAKIKDKPFYRHRGLLLDTARNYLPLKTIKKQIDAMAASKLNVFHWHITDSQSFPLVSKRVPLLSMYGAYSSKQIYLLSDIIELILYAKYRGVRILMEIDSPSHVGNGWQWGPLKGLGHLAVCVNQNPWRQFCIQPPCGQFNPANMNVYHVLHDLYKDLLEILSTKEYFHMGGDEVFFNCWNTTEEIISYMSKKNWGRSVDDFLNLWSEFQNYSLNAFDLAANKTNTPIILWSSQLTDIENIEKYLSKDRYIIQSWVPTTNDLPKTLLEKGYKIIISTKNAWYLDHGFWGITQYYNWRTVYKNRILEHPNVLGGEACMWGEYVDKNSIDSKIWPRAAAMAERLWSNPDFDIKVVENRFYRQRQRLVSRGIKADAVAPVWCIQNEGECY